MARAGFEHRVDHRLGIGPDARHVVLSVEAFRIDPVGTPVPDGRPCSMRGRLARSTLEHEDKGDDADEMRAFRGRQTAVLQHRFQPNSPECQWRRFTERDACNESFKRTQVSLDC
ncbi:hypothetical protein BSLA_02f4313 [Burkholderia stabilis]|nr:hypothetical protein BSLA_02f4313 [Burkholderia stabilis]